MGDRGEASRREAHGDIDLICEASAERDIRYYRCYGMTIATDLELSELAPTPPAKPDLWILRDVIDRPLSDVPGDRIEEFGDKEIYLGWNGIGRFLLTQGIVVRYQPDPSLALRLLSFAVLGPVLGLILQRKQYLVLHASAILVEGRAAIFLGDKGAGKSTTAAAFLASGHKLLTDDLVAIDLSGERPTILPGYPSVKLTKRAIDLLKPPITGIIPTEVPGFDKERTRFEAYVDDASIEAGGVYILRRGDDAALQPMEAPEALSQLIRFSYAVRFGSKVIRGAEATRHFEQCAQTVNAVPVQHLTVPDTIDRLPEAVLCVEDNLRRIR